MIVLWIVIGRRMIPPPNFVAPNTLPSRNAMPRWSGRAIALHHPPEDEERAYGPADQRPGKDRRDPRRIARRAGLSLLQHRHEWPPAPPQRRCAGRLHDHRTRARA